MRLIDGLIYYSAGGAVLPGSWVITERGEVFRYVIAPEGLGDSSGFWEKVGNVLSQIGGAARNVAAQFGANNGAGTVTQGTAPAPNPQDGATIGGGLQLNTTTLLIGALVVGLLLWR